jgi:hypothetical protein
MQQLDVLLQKILPKTRDRVKRRIMPMLVSYNCGNPTAAVSLLMLLTPCKYATMLSCN